MAEHENSIGETSEWYTPKFNQFFLVARSHAARANDLLSARQNKIRPS